ncbi:hypothetical protein STRTUCAR8_04298 [Streptomyces turgidiscabies Car8]|uniref:Uncharacterized protein n=1 Tax=Streptomyces turgidiscabies (strain Car8) TaxID=698760 RepID=L7F655_STRT8|nr:hypothetical protein STRTUCAR8_04298 [Streptomyces turgidiscabies Car8]
MGTRIRMPVNGSTAAAVHERDAQLQESSAQFISHSAPTPRISHPYEERMRRKAVS